MGWMFVRKKTFLANACIDKFQFLLPQVPPAAAQPPPPPPPPPPTAAPSPSYAYSSSAPTSHAGYPSLPQFQRLAPSAAAGRPVARPGPAYPDSGGRPGASPAAPAGRGVPIEKVIDDVAVMGFSREEVRRVLNQLMESGQAVDLNVVLDRLGAR